MKIAYLFIVDDTPEIRRLAAHLGIAALDQRSGTVQLSCGIEWSKAMGMNRAADHTEEDADAGATYDDIGDHAALRFFARRLGLSIPPATEEP